MINVLERAPDRRGLLQGAAAPGGFRLPAAAAQDESRRIILTTQSRSMLAR
jgi:hypothetical protein